MKNYKDILKIIIVFLISLFTYILTISIFGKLISYKISSILSFIFINMIFLLSGFKFSKKSNLRGFISGGLIGLTQIFIMIIMGLIVGGLEFKILTYYLILFLSSVIGGMIGANTKKAN